MSRYPFDSVALFWEMVYNEPEIAKQLRFKYRFDNPGTYWVFVSAIDADETYPITQGASLKSPRGRKAFRNCRMKSSFRSPA